MNDYIKTTYCGKNVHCGNKCPIIYFWYARGKEYVFKKFGGVILISTLDSIIVLVYIVGMITVGYFLGKKNETSDDYFLAGRSMPWLPIGLSVAATMMSANGFIGGPGWAYSDGISPYMVNIGVPLAIFFVMLTTMPVIYNLRITSVYEYVELRLGVLTRMLAVLGFIANSVIQISSMVFIPALIINTFTGWSLQLVVPVIVVAAIVYTMLGGIKAVIWTDAVQMVVLWGGLLISFIVIFSSTGIGFFDSISVASNAGRFSALDFSLDISRTNAVWATLIGGTIMWIRYFGFDQGQVQRVLTASSMKGVKSSFLVSALIMNVMYFVFMFLGVMLFVFYNGRSFDSANSIMIDFIGNHLPVGFVGLLISAVFAAAMSSVDSLLNSMTTVFTKDIYERFFVKESKSTSLKMAMMISAVWGIIIIFVTLFSFSGTTQSVLATVGSYISYISGPMCGVFFLSMFTRKAHDKGVALGAIIGFFITMYFGRNAGASWIWNPAVGAFTTFAIGYIASLLLPSGKTVEETEEYTVIGQRKKLLETNKGNGKNFEDGVSILPLAFDRYVWLVLGFFLIQYVILAIIG